MSAILSTIYTLTQTHCGTGQAARAIDLPIAREASTNLPILPATTLKGVARATLSAALEDPIVTDGNSKLEKKDIVELFGSELNTDPGDEDDPSANMLSSGALVIGEGHLLIYPFRALHQPVVFATCPLLLERLDRALRASGLESELSRPNEDLENESILDILRKDSSRSLWISSDTTRPIVLEDRIFTPEHTKSSIVVKKVAILLASFLPKEEVNTSTRIENNLAIVQDAIFCQLIGRVTPVQARIKLTSGKTTGIYKDPVTGKEERDGNLWYEETLPSDCLFWSLIRHRTGKAKLGAQTVEERFQEFTSLLRYVQIGGNETVGQGQCIWNFQQGNEYGQKEEQEAASEAAKEK